ncbi:Pre-mRNA-splicing factor SYF1 [Tritrichomonas foetus]|uniref:Pre-mRNA-splicing factor SYF1 n=1 Tax=Tritrichomonas foetus TaxID=1144522 RepID=A0A1J4K4J8_9EUKA|nr:Pre-mRNA-splicing factor SYF1 [Tritrichomonas foetus]|eukprot:OHT06115.1 Pre-mRNA-splicing factor SYF1 [Tritrichomonas foetus]
MELAVQDIGYEQQLTRNINGISLVRTWLSYILIKKQHYLNMNFPNGVPDQRELAKQIDQLWIYYNRAVKQYPRSYKIWADYCDTRSSYVIQFLNEDELSIQMANGTYERALHNLWTCPRLWLDYLNFLGKQKRLSLLRRTFNRALQSLPITQHDRLWEAYLHIIRDLHAVATTDDAYRRFLKLHPEHIEDACEFFIAEKSTRRAAFYLKMLLNDPNFQSLNNRPKYYWWTQLAEVVGLDPYIEDAEKLLRDGCKGFVVETGRVWVLIAEHFARLGLFADAIQTFEDAMNSTITAHDFALVFQGEVDLLYSIAMKSDKFSMYLQKLDDLLNRRPLLLNSTKLRHNKNNVMNWIERVTLHFDKEYSYEARTRKNLWEQLEPMTTQLGQLLVMEEAIETVEPRLAIQGKYCDLWTNLSKLVDIPFAVLEAALNDESLLSSDLVGIYCYYIELELSNGNEGHALEIARRAVSDKRANSCSGSSQLWSLALDVEWSFGSPSTIKYLFEQCMVSKAVTMRHVLSYAKFLEDSKHYDEMFRVFERGINQVGWPNCSALWLFYLHKFVSTYGGKHRERTRDLFEDALNEAPPKEAQAIFILYAKFEEDFGMMRRAMEIYRRASDICKSDEVIHVWVAAACRLYGVAKAREVYEYAVSQFAGDRRCSEWCLRYAALETKLTEYERARTIYIHGGQFAEPDTFAHYWDEYEEFEKKHGTKQTYKEMLSQKNVAVARFNRTIHVGLAQEGKGIVSKDEDEELNDVEATREVLNAEVKIPETIYDGGSFTAIERFAKRNRSLLTSKK